MSALRAVGAEDRVSLDDLRTLLRIRFPGSAPPSASALQEQADEVEGGGGRVLRSGVAEWDEACSGLRLGEVSEVCGGLGGAGLVMDSLLHSGAQAGWMGAWVDAGDALEVADWPSSWMKNMLWVRCRQPFAALKAADLLLRDGNLSWVVLDLQGVPASALRRISAQHWHRFHRLVKHHGNALLVLTPVPMVEGARVRVSTRQSWSLEELTLPRAQLRADLGVHVYVRGRHPERGHVEQGHTGPQTGLQKVVFLKKSA